MRLRNETIGNFIRMIIDRYYFNKKYRCNYTGQQNKFALLGNLEYQQIIMDISIEKEISLDRKCTGK